MASDNGFDEEKLQNEIVIEDQGAALTFGSLSNDNGPWRGSAHHGPTQLDTFNPLSGLGGPSQMMSKGSQMTGIHMESMAFSSSGLGSLGQQPLSFAPSSNVKQPLLEVLPNDNMEMDFSEFKTEPAFFVPSKCAAPSGLQMTPQYYNELTSIVVDETPRQVLDKMSTILSKYSNDIDFKVDTTNFSIIGQVFVHNLAVFFKITVWDEGKDRTRFECRRTKGDTVAFTEFWNKLEEALYQQFGNPIGFGQGQDANAQEADEEFGALPPLAPLDYNLTLDLGDLESDDANNDKDEATGLTPKHLGDFVDDMKQSDPSVVYTIAMLIDALQTSTASMLLNNAAFLQCIIESVLTHRDTALVRGALVMLAKLCDDCESGADTLIGYRVLDQVIPLLNHDLDLIRKHAVRLLGKLTAAKAWKLENEKLGHYAKRSVKECRDNWQNAPCTKNGFIETSMLDDINKKLISVM